MSLFRRLAAVSLSVLSLPAADAPPKPLFRDFTGLNVHTVLFKPDLYRPATRLVRDYHPFSWDVGDETDFATTFPFARNRVDWGNVYGSWKRAGYVTDVSLMFDDTPPAKWKDLAKDSRTYAAAFAKAFGPSGERKLVESVEIGNEPGKYDDAAYRTLFENAARGFREGDPALKIATCNVLAKPSGEYHKSVDVLKGFESLYDIFSVHSYAFAEGWPTWRRSFPEDPKIDFLKDIEAVIAWRNANAPGKPVWLTEFGWDATTQPQATEGTFKDWVGVTDQQQARYLVRALLVLSELDLGRAYIYFFNDEDEASVHASSGLTRNFTPKPAFHAVAHSYATLGDYRFSKAITKTPGELYVYEFTRGGDPKQRIWAAWSPTGSGRTSTVTLPIPPGTRIERAERMPLAAGQAETVKWTPTDSGARLEIGESPTYLWLRW
jgi:hypothetical protein